MECPKRINLLQLVDGFRLGGAEIKLLELINHLDKDRNRITVCSLTSDSLLRKDFEGTGVNVKVFPRKHRFDVTLIPKLVRFLRKERIDVVQTTLFYADILGTIAARLAGIPVVISWETISHEHAFYTPKHRGLSYRLIMRFADGIVAVSEGVKKSIITLRKIPPAKIKIIHYGVDLVKYHRGDGQAKRNQLGLSDEYPVLGVVARLEEVKGHKYLIEALPAIVQKYSQIRCLIVGDGGSRSELEKRVQELGLSDKVIFLGFRNDVAELLTVFDLFVLPSISEGLPNVILEAMACSLPVIATSVGGIPEVIISGQNGILVPPADSEALKSSILNLLDNPTFMRTLASRARKSVKERFSLENQVRQFQKLYDYYFEKKKVLTDSAAR